MGRSRSESILIESIALLEHVPESETHVSGGSVTNSGLPFCSCGNTLEAIFLVQEFFLELLIPSLTTGLEGGI